MRELSKRVSLSLPAPIQVDSTEPDVMERTLEQIPGRAIVNSVNLEAGPRQARHGRCRIAKRPRRGADRPDHRRGGHGQDARPQARGRPAHPRHRGRRARARPRAADLRRAHLHPHHRRRGVAPQRRRDDRGHPADQGRDPAASRPRSASPTCPSASRRTRAGCSTRCSCTTAWRPASTWRWSIPPRSRPTRRSPRTSASSPTRSCLNRSEDALEKFIEHFESKGEEAEDEKADPTAGMEPEEALHWHILRRKKEGVEDWIDKSVREDRRRADPQPGAAAGHEGGGGQVRGR